MQDCARKFLGLKPTSIQKQASALRKFITLRFIPSFWLRQTVQITNFLTVWTQF